MVSFCHCYSLSQHVTHNWSLCRHTIYHCFPLSIIMVPIPMPKSSQPVAYLSPAAIPALTQPDVSLSNPGPTNKCLPVPLLDDVCVLSEVLPASHLPDSLLYFYTGMTVLPTPVLQMVGLGLLYITLQTSHQKVVSQLFNSHRIYSPCLLNGWCLENVVKCSCLILRVIKYER